MCVKWGQSHCELRQSCDNCYQQQGDVRNTRSSLMMAPNLPFQGYCSSENRTYFKVWPHKCTWIFLNCVCLQIKTIKWEKLTLETFEVVKWAILNQTGSGWSLQWIDSDNKQFHLLKFSGKDNHRRGSKVLCSLMMPFWILALLTTQNNSFCNNSQRVEPPSKESGKTRSLC